MEKFSKVIINSEGEILDGQERLEFIKKHMNFLDHIVSGNSSEIEEDCKEVKEKNENNLIVQ
jgi:hypothetical protein